MTDVVNSTGAIAEGRYKDVNTAGAIAGMAVANLAGSLEFPFVFGGDGFTYVLPSVGLAEVKSVLADTQRLVRDSFSLELRVGVVRVAELYARGLELRIGRMRVSDRYTQAIFDGGGLPFAEDLVKGYGPRLPGSTYAVPEDYPVTRRADSRGFSCRWKDIPSARGETVSLIVSVRDTVGGGTVLPDVLAAIEGILGDVSTYHPLREETQVAETAHEAIAREATVHTRGPRGLRHLIDAADGGYALAAKALKEQKQQRARRSSSDANSKNSQSSL